MKRAGRRTSAAWTKVSACFGKGGWEPARSSALPSSTGSSSCGSRWRCWSTSKSELPLLLLLLLGAEPAAASAAQATRSRIGRSR